MHGEGGLLSLQDTHRNEPNGQIYASFSLPNLAGNRSGGAAGDDDQRAGRRRQQLHALGEPAARVAEGDRGHLELRRRSGHCGGHRRRIGHRVGGLVGGMTAAQLADAALRSVGAYTNRSAAESLRGCI